MDLTFFAYLLASIVALWYACLRGLTPSRRIAVAGLALVLEFSAGLLLVSPHNSAAYAIGFPCALALGLVMTAPRQRTGAAGPAGAAIPFPRRPAAANTAPLPVLTDPWASLYASMSGQYTGPAQEPAGPARRRTDRVAGARPGGRAGYAVGGQVVHRPHRRRTASAAFSRALRCTRR